MPRPPKVRRVEYMPSITYFKPAGIPMRELEEVILAVEELEAVRLKDLEGLEQEEGAIRMGVSRSTFQRILVSAREKIADALVSGKALRVEGGTFKLAKRVLKCKKCGHEAETQKDSQCPSCGERLGSGFHGRRGYRGRSSMR